MIVRASPGRREGNWTDFLSGDAFKRAVYGLFALLILAFTLYGMMGAVTVVSVAAIVALIVVVVAVGPENRRLQHNLVLAIMLVVISGGVFSD